jgi:low affinity Fe/Cu permease
MLRVGCNDPRAGRTRPVYPFGGILVAGGGSHLSDFFRRAAHKVTLLAGSWQLFVLSVALIAVWGLSGPIFAYSDTWQLVVNTSTTILTYLLGILILMEANRQAKESKVVHDELIRAVRGARNELINIDQMTDEEVDMLEAKLRRRARSKSPQQPSSKNGSGSRAPKAGRNGASRARKTPAAD